jgi:hypothetical protein
MPTNNTMIMLGLGAAALWFLGNRGENGEDQVDQLTSSAMMAAGEGTSPNAPFMPLSMPSDPVFFFNQGGEMAQTPYSGVPSAARAGEDIGQHISGRSQPELEFKVARNNAAVGTSDQSPTTPQFAGGTVRESDLVPSTLWDDPIAIAEANKMPMLAIQDTGSWEIGTGGIKILGANVDIATLSSKDQFRAVQVDASGAPSLGAITGGFTTDADTLAQYVQGFIETPYNPQLFDQPARQSANDPSAVDEDRGVHPGGGNPSELEFNVALTGIPASTSDISPATPEFASSFTFGRFMTEEMDFTDFTPATPEIPTLNLITDVSPTGQIDWSDPWI